MTDGFDLTPEQEAEYMAAMEEVERDPPAGSGQVVDFKEGSEKVRRKKRKEKPVGLEQAIREIIHAINGELQYLPSWFAKFPFPYRVRGYQKHASDEWTYYREHIEGRYLEPISAAQITADVRRWTERLFVSDREVQEIVNCYRLNYVGCEQVAKQWHCYADPMREVPKLIGFLDDQEILIRRLPWHDRLGVTEEAMQEKCPMWSSILDRMENSQWFAWRIGSLFDTRADRKQAVFVYGEADTGKSQIQDWLSTLCGHAAVTIGHDDLRTNKFYKSSLVNRAVCLVAEAANSFLNTPAFKSLTGDKVHQINAKNKAMYHADILAKFFFFSNDKPACNGAKETMLRIIPCELRPFEAGPKIPSEDLQDQLWRESDWFLGYCRSVYRSHAGLRAEPTQDSIHEANEQSAQEWVDVFDELFERDPNGRLARKDVRMIVTDTYGGAVQSKHYQQWLNAVKRYCGVEDWGRVRFDGTRDRILIGLKPNKRTLQIYAGRLKNLR